MFRKEFTTIEEVQAFIQPLLDEKKWIVDIQQKSETEPFFVEWQEHKMYTAMDGKEYHDEVWRTQKGDLILIQDLSEAHCRNVLRMILRQEREYDHQVAQQVTQLKERLADAISGGEFDGLFGGTTDDDSDAIYHPPGSTTLQ